MKRILSLTASCLLASTSFAVDLIDTMDGPKPPGLWGAGYDSKLTTANKVSGSHSLAFTYPGEPDGEDSTSEIRFFLPEKMSEVYVEYDLFIPSNYYHRRQTNLGFPGDNNKSLVQLWSGTYGARASNVYVGLEQWPVGDGGSNPSIRLGSNHVDMGHVHAHKMAIGKEIMRVPEDRGKWHHFKVHVKLADAGKANGIVEVWRNNELIIKSNPLDNYSAAGNYFTHGYVLGWANSGYAKQTTFYVDNFRIRGTSFSGNSVQVTNVPPMHPVLRIE